MASLPIRDYDADRQDERDASDGEESDLRPYFLLRGPRVRLAPWRQGLGSVENCKGRREHGQDDQTAAEADAS